MSKWFLAALLVLEAVLEVTIRGVAAVQEPKRIQVEGDGESPGEGSSGAEDSGDQQSTGGQ